MACFKWCVTHGWYKDAPTCPACELIDKFKRSTKYGGVSINIPPHMKAVK